MSFVGTGVAVANCVNTSISGVPSGSSGVKKGTVYSSFIPSARY